MCMGFIITFKVKNCKAKFDLKIEVVDLITLVLKILCKFVYFESVVMYYMYI